MLAFSQAANRTSTTSPVTPGTITRTEPHPCTGASMIDHSTSPMPTMDRIAPTTSGRGVAGFFESGTHTTAHSAPAMAMGTLMRNTDPHQKWASRSPPTIGPRAKPTPLVPAQNPMARWRSWGSRKTSVMMARVEGIMSAAPMPMLARAAMSTLTEPENAAHTDPAAKASSPARNVRLRPTRSARLPDTRSRPPSTRA